MDKEPKGAAIITAGRLANFSGFQFLLFRIHQAPSAGPESGICLPPASSGLRGPHPRPDGVLSRCLLGSRPVTLRGEAPPAESLALFVQPEKVAEEEKTSCGFSSFFSLLLLFFGCVGSLLPLFTFPSIENSNRSSFIGAVCPNKELSEPAKINPFRKHKTPRLQDKRAKNKRTNQKELFSDLDFRKI